MDSIRWPASLNSNPGAANVLPPNNTASPGQASSPTATSSSARYLNINGLVQSGIVNLSPLDILSDAVLRFVLPAEPVGDLHPASAVATRAARSRSPMGSR